LRVEISLLEKFEKIENPLDWKVGTHGIEIEFKDPKKESKIYRGTFLPNVAPEQGWTE
jgi:AMME syndrome candidate gene 1 protein